MPLYASVSAVWSTGRAETAASYSNRSLMLSSGFQFHIQVRAGESTFCWGVGASLGSSGKGS